jgi:alpha-1,3-fucosyltransferase 10
LSKNAQEFGSADVVVFHAPTHKSTPKKKSAKSLYALISLEQPKYAKMLSNTGRLSNHFDLLMTYSLETTYPKTQIPNMPLTYYPLNILSPRAVIQAPRPFQNKDGYGEGVAVALFTSNCKAAGATGRYKYLETLMKHIKVHSYGKCLQNREEPEMPEDPAWPKIAQRRARKVKVLSHYKFYLAFENDAVDDYVSEKVFEGLFAGAVPIYRGSRSIHKFMPGNDSYIDANNLEPEELANTLQRLSTDEAAYNKYMAFKQRPLPESFQQIAMMSYTHPNVLCRLCDYALETRNL